MGFYLTKPTTPRTAAEAPPDCPLACPARRIPSGSFASEEQHRGPTSNRILSSKYRDGEGYLYYYGYRYYAPEVGRWAKRDPAGEVRGSGLYGFAANGPLGRVDGVGLDWLQIDCESGKVSWGVVDSSVTPVKWYEIGVVPASSRTGSWPVTIDVAFGSGRVDLWDLAGSANGIQGRFGLLDSLPEAGQKAAIKLGIKYSSAPVSFRSLDEAGTYGSWLARGKSQSDGYEWGGWLLETTLGLYQLKDPVTSRSPVTVKIHSLDPIASNPTIKGWYHGHPTGTGGLSASDRSAQRMYESLTRSAHPPRTVFCEFGFAVTADGEVFKTNGGLPDILVVP